MLYSFMSSFPLVIPVEGTEEGNRNALIEALSQGDTVYLRRGYSYDGSSNNTIKVLRQDRQVVGELKAGRRYTEEDILEVLPYISASVSKVVPLSARRGNAKRSVLEITLTLSRDYVDSEIADIEQRLSEISKRIARLNQEYRSLVNNRAEMDRQYKESKALIQGCENNRLKNISKKANLDASVKRIDQDMISLEATRLGVIKQYTESINQLLNSVENARQKCERIEVRYINQSRLVRDLYRKSQNALLKRQALLTEYEQAKQELDKLRLSFEKGQEYIARKEAELVYQNKAKEEYIFTTKKNQRELQASLATKRRELAVCMRESGTAVATKEEMERCSKLEDELRRHSRLITLMQRDIAAAEKEEKSLKSVKRSLIMCLNMAR